jgi:hypothetical protein
MMRLGPLSQITLGFVIGFAALGAASCASLTSVTPLVECKLSTLRVLPDDPNQITVADLRDIAGRLRACHAAEKADAGAR